MRRSSQSWPSLIRVLALICALAAVACAPQTPQSGPQLAQGELARTQVEATERAFAKTMADRDLAAFRGFLADETVFFSGPTPLRGVEDVTDYWSRYFEGPEAPFSWEPDQVEVLESGTLALSTGPVHGPDGKVIARFSSIWRQESPGVWRIVFDRGEPVPVAAATPQ